jgi:tetratricopeptide (TPR) repeat protein
MPWAREAAAPDLSFPVGQPHSHNLALGVLGDAGIVGLAAAAIVVIALFRAAGPWRCRTFTGSAAAAALLGIGVSGLFEDLTFLPNFNLVVILLAALALADAGAVEWRPVRRPALATTGVAAIGAALLGIAWLVADAGAIAYRAGIDASATGDWPAAATAFETSVVIDPWQPSGPDALGVALAASGHPERARDALEAAVRLAPGNGRAWANLSVVCGELGDDGCRLDAAREAVSTARLREPTLAIAALALEALGRTEEADAAYRRSLLTNPATAFGVEWPRTVPIGDGRIEGFAEPISELGILLGRAEMGEPIDPADYEADAVRALALAHLGDDPAAREALADARRLTPHSLVTWAIDLALSRAWGEPVTSAETNYRILNGWPVTAPDQPELSDTGLLNEIAAFRSFPRNGLVPGAEEFAVVPPYPWFLATIVGEGSAGER